VRLAGSEVESDVKKERQLPSDNDISEDDIIETVTNGVQLNVSSVLRVTSDFERYICFADTAGSFAGMAISFADIADSFADIAGSVADTEGTFVDIEGSFAEMEGSSAGTRGSFAEMQGSLAGIWGSFMEVESFSAVL